MSLISLQTQSYTTQQKTWPSTGKHILAQFDNSSIVVYQAYRKDIADFAVKNQFFGGPFSLNRMSWIKPNFLWMMYRSGWATKVDQERVLAIRISREGFDSILQNAVYSSFTPSVYSSQEEWKSNLESFDVRLQWDPDHDPYGRPLERRAIQLGMKGDILRKYAKDWILKIEDITDFVTENYQYILSNELNKLNCPVETIYPVEDLKVSQKIFSQL